MGLQVGRDNRICISTPHFIYARQVSSFILRGTPGVLTTGGHFRTTGTTTPRFIDKSDISILNGRYILYIYRNDTFSFSFYRNRLRVAIGGSTRFRGHGYTCRGILRTRTGEAFPRVVGGYCPTFTSCYRTIPTLGVHGVGNR